MPIFRPFAYNPSASSITGASQFGNLAIGNGTVDYSTNPGGVKWFSGPDEENGYVIALAVTGGNQPTADGLNDGTVQFWRSGDKTDASFIGITNVVSKQYGNTSSFVAAETAKSWLNDNNFWTSWVSSVGVTAQFYYDPSISSSYSGSGNIVNNIGSIGNTAGSTGSLVGVSYVANIAGGVFDFDGIADTISFGRYNYGDNITINAWVYPRSEYSINCLMSNAGANTNTNGFKASWNGWNTQNLNMNFEAGNGISGGTQFTGNNTIVENSWQMITYVFNRTAQTINFYRNGIQIAQAGGGSPVANIGTNNANWWIGSIGGNSYYMDAYLGAFKIWTSIINESSILQEFNNSKSKYGL